MTSQGARPSPCTAGAVAEPRSYLEGARIRSRAIHRRSRSRIKDGFEIRTESQGQPAHLRTWAALDRVARGLAQIRQIELYRCHCEAKRKQSRPPLDCFVAALIAMTAKGDSVSSKALPTLTRKNGGRECVVRQIKSGSAAGDAEGGDGEEVGRWDI